MQHPVPEETCPEICLAVRDCIATLSHFADKWEGARIYRDLYMNIADMCFVQGCVIDSWVPSSYGSSQVTSSLLDRVREQKLHQSMIQMIDAIVSQPKP